MRIYEVVNFKEFAKLLSAFSSRATRDTKLEYMFMVHDVDGDGRWAGGALGHLMGEGSESICLWCMTWMGTVGGTSRGGDEAGEDGA